MSIWYPAPTFWLNVQTVPSINFNDLPLPRLDSTQWPTSQSQCTRASSKRMKRLNNCE